MRWKLLHGLLVASAVIAFADASLQRDDLAAFVQNFFNVDRSYTPAARAEAAKRLHALGEKVGSISDAQFILSLAQIAALADNGHSNLMYRGPAGGGRVGVRFVPFGGEFVVAHAAAEHADLLGARLAGVDGAMLAQLVDSARTLTGGTVGHRDDVAPMFLESVVQLYAMGLARATDRATYHFRLANGQTRDVELRAVPIPRGQHAGYDGAAILFPLAPSSGWRSLLSAERVPWSLREPDSDMRFRDAPEIDATVIQLRTNLDGERPIASFLASADSARKAAGRKNVVLDMRMNGGGNLTLTEAWMSSLPSRLPRDGRVVILTSPWTFSAAISSAGYVKQAGGDRVILVGETPGDRLRFWAEGQGTMLPRSGAYIGTATARHDYITGCKPYTDCHRYMVTHPIAVPNLDPDVRAPWTVEAYAAGRDPGMEAAAKVLALPPKVHSR